MIPVKVSKHEYGTGMDKNDGYERVKDSEFFIKGIIKDNTIVIIKDILSFLHIIFLIFLFTK